MAKDMGFSHIIKSVPAGRKGEGGFRERDRPGQASVEFSSAGDRGLWSTSKPTGTRFSPHQA